MTNVSSSTQSANFASVFQRPADVSASAPGRVNLIGDHTDYNGGYVLPMVLPQGTLVEAALRSDRIVRVSSRDVEAADALFEYRVGQELSRGHWTDYVMGITAVLAEEGYVVPGVDLRLSSTIPLGAGLSSSASLLVALLRALTTVMAVNVSQLAIARLAHRAETEFVQAPVGIMDQMVCALGRPASAFFLDTATLDYEHVAIPAGLGWVVVHSGVTHSHASGSYQTRRRECEAASSVLGVRWMRDLERTGRQAVLALIDELPVPLDARARHVVTENDRVLAAVDMLRGGNLPALGMLMNASHLSLRDDFQVSVPETNLLAELAQGARGVYGARLTGGGFGGSVVIAVEHGLVNDVADHVATHYRTHSGRVATVLLPMRQQPSASTTIR
jgi:galactokinase